MISCVESNSKGVYLPIDSRAAAHNLYVAPTAALKPASAK